MSTYYWRALHSLCSASKTFVLFSFHVFPHFFHETRCFIFLFFPLEKCLPVSELVSVPFFFLFVCGRTFDHCVKVSISLPCHFCSMCDLLFFHKCINSFTFCRDFFPLTFGFYMLPSVQAALHPAAALCGLLPPGFRGAIPFSAFPPITFLCHGRSQNRSCFLNAWIVFLFCGANMKTTGTPCVLFLSSKGPRLPMLQIIHHCFLLHHLHQKKRM